jgi:hypothetical protein
MRQIFEDSKQGKGRAVRVRLTLAAIGYIF